MRLVLFFPAILLLTGCGDIKGYDATRNESPSSLMGSQGGGGVETDIWSSNPSQKTLTSDSQYGP